MRLSIIIPVYNAEEHIAQCVNSILDQGFDKKDYEIILVNDGSTDHSLEIIQDLVFQGAPIKLIDKENGGPSTARNAGMVLAQGNYVYFLDSDDFLLPNSLKTVLETIEHYDLDILTFVSRTLSNPSEMKFIPDGSENEGKHELISHIVDGEAYLAELNFGGEVWLYLINHEFLKKSEIRFQEGQYLEDVIFTLMIFLKARRMAHIQLDTHRYRTTPGSAMTNTEPQHYLKIINDLLGAAVVYSPILNKLKLENPNPGCIDRIKSRQQSFVFFAMVRMFRSTMNIDQIKKSLSEMERVQAYPLHAFIGKEYSDLKYKVLVPLFNRKWIFYSLFRILNPIIKYKN